MTRRFTIGSHLLRSIRFLISLGSILFLFACASTPNTNIDYDTQYQFQNKNTLRWASPDERKQQNSSALKALGPKTPAQHSNTIINSANTPNLDLIEKRIKRFTQAALKQQGFQFNASNASMLVDYEIKVHHYLTRDSYYYPPFGLYFEDCYRYTHGCFHQQIRGEVREYQQSVLFLVIKFLDIQDMKVVWQGITVLPKDKRKLDPHQYDQAIQTAVMSLVSQFPPAALPSPPP